MGAGCEAVIEFHPFNEANISESFQQMKLGLGLYRHQLNAEQPAGRPALNCAGPWQRAWINLAIFAADCGSPASKKTHGESECDTCACELTPVA